MRSTFKVLFYLKRNASKKNGLIPVMCRITVNGKGSIRIQHHFVRNEPNLNVEFRGYTFTDEDKKALCLTGNLGHVADLVNKDTGEVTPSFISIDRKTNKILTYPAGKLHLRDKIGTTPLTKEELDILKTAAPLPNKDVELANGCKFTVTLRKKCLRS